MKYPELKRDLPSFPHSLFNTPLEQLVRFYREHIERDINSGKLRPTDFWITARLFLISGIQTYVGICALLSADQPKPLMLQAGILNRSLLETLGNVLALCQAPKIRTRILQREAFRNAAERLLTYQQRFGHDKEWQDYLSKYREGLHVWARELGISRTYLFKPDQMRDSWPTPGRMIYGGKKRKKQPFLRGSRLAAFKEIYEYHYGKQSEQAHQRELALGITLIVDKQEQWNPGHGESDIVTTAILFLTCMISELEFQGKYRPHPRLPELWTYLRDIDDEAKDLWRIRYSKLVTR